MSNITQQQQQLTQLLSAELNESHQLLDILMEEHQALSSSDPDLITSISAKKLDALKRVEQHYTQRAHFLTRIGLSSGNEEMETIIKRLPKESLLVTQWHALQEIAKKLHRQNEINGGIIALTQRHLTLALDILNGKANITPTSTYGRSGQANSEATPQHIAKA